MERTGGSTARCAGDEIQALSARSAAAVVAQVDHRIGQRLDRIVQRTDSIEAKQQAPKLVFPAEHALDRIKPFFENGRVEQWLATAPGSFSAARIRVDVRNHAAIENGFAVGVGRNKFVTTPS